MALYDRFKKYPKISTDTRNIAENSIFFALKGDSFDGNSFAIEALRCGAKYAVVDDIDVVEKGCDSGLYEEYFDFLIVVEDALFELQMLAVTHRVALGIPILAITGTNGKTTTKELVTRVLSCNYNVYSTKGNLNNHIGVPLTLLSMNNSTEFGIVEMGASACGEIEFLCAIARPNFGLITNIGRAHLDGFGGIDGVRIGKGELYDYLHNSDGIAFVQKDNEDLISMTQEREGLQCEFYLKNISNGVKSHLVGEYNQFNIAAAVAIGQYFDVDMCFVSEAISSYKPDNKRSQMVETDVNTLIVDCYNANPSSMSVALDSFSDIVGNVRDKSVIIGVMLELGIYSEEEHRVVLDRVAKMGVKSAYFVGDEFASLRDYYLNVSGFSFFPNSKELEEYLANNPLKERLVLLKGSNSIGLSKLVDVL